MKVLALTHAHLNKKGLSPVSCERADSITGTWSGRLGWEVDVIHTRDTKWVGIWPGGEGLKINIISVEAPPGLMQSDPQLFSVQVKQLLAKKNITGLFFLTYKRAAKHIRNLLVEKGLVWPGWLVAAKKWGEYLAGLLKQSNKKYDFIFVCVGYGDEYLLQTAYTLSEKLKLRMVVDFRDLWSDHHDPARFTDKQKKQIRRYEEKLLSSTSLISVPQKHLKFLVDTWSHCPVYHLPHSAYVHPDWLDGQLVDSEFRILYAGKLYAEGPGITMLLDLMKKLPAGSYPKPISWHFFVDDTAALKKMIEENGIYGQIVINEWVSPSMLWPQIRSAHLLVIIDSSTLENYPILLTKTFQYAYSGQQILCLQKYENPEMAAFLKTHNAGLVTTSTVEAEEWIKKLSLSVDLYNRLPPLRNIPQREDIAEAFGHEIDKYFKNKTTQ